MSTACAHATHSPQTLAHYAIPSAGAFERDERLRRSCFKTSPGLIENSTLVPDGDSHRFTRHHEFNSPTLAASLILGNPKIGGTEWKTTSDTPLKQFQEAEVVLPAVDGSSE